MIGYYTLDIIIIYFSTQSYPKLHRFLVDFNTYHTTKSARLQYINSNIGHIVCVCALLIIAYTPGARDIQTERLNVDPVLSNIIPYGNGYFIVCKLRFYPSGWFAIR